MGWYTREEKNANAKRFVEDENLPTQVTMTFNSLPKSPLATGFSGQLEFLKPNSILDYLSQMTRCLHSGALVQNTRKGGLPTIFHSRISNHSLNGKQNLSLSCLSLGLLIFRPPQQKHHRTLPLFLFD